MKVIGIVLAGGRASRLGGVDKGLLPIRGKALISYTLERLKPQVEAICISANRHIDRYSEFGYPVIADFKTDYTGPLTGIVSVMQAIEQQSADYVFVTACDMPMLPMDFIRRVELFQKARFEDHKQLDPATIFIAHDGKRLQPFCSLIPLQLIDNLSQSIEEKKVRVISWFENNKATTIDYQDSEESFLNINTQSDIQIFEARL